MRAKQYSLLFFIIALISLIVFFVSYSLYNPVSYDDYGMPGIDTSTPYLIVVPFYVGIASLIISIIFYLKSRSPTKTTAE